MTNAFCCNIIQYVPLEQLKITNVLIWVVSQKSSGYTNLTECHLILTHTY